MEADWSVEIGSDLPCIDAAWDGFIDLRFSSHAIDLLPEAAGHSALYDALIALNATDSPVFTTKCDAWSMTAEEIDPDEFAASSEDALTGFASYTDLVVRDSAYFASFAFHETLVRDLTTHLREIALRRCRVDLVLRAAFIGDQIGYGITAYAAGCGPNESTAYIAWQAALAAAVAATITTVRASSSIG
jgi:hypothetical protein